MKSLVRVVLVAVAGLGLLFGCGTAEPANSPAASSASSAATSQATTITITDHAGREVTLPKTASKVFGAGPPATTLIYALDPGLLAGWNSPVTEATKPYLTGGTESLPVLGRVTGGKDTFNPEVLNANGVDLIIDACDINDKYIDASNDLQKKTGIPVIMLSTDPAKMADAFTIMGQATGMTEAAQNLSSEVDRIAALVKKGADAAQGSKSVYYAVSEQGLTTSQSGSINARVIDSIVATNVAGKAAKSGRIEITAEQVLTYIPDWVIISPDSAKDQIATDPKAVQPIGSLKAVQEDRYLVVPNGMPFGWFDGPPSVNQLLGMMWSGKAIYPNYFDLDLTAETMSFYKNFFHHELSEDEAKTILATAHTPGY